MQNEKTISIAGKIYCQLRHFRFRCRSRFNKRSKFNSKCGPTFSPPCTWRTAGEYINSWNMSLSSKSIPDFCILRSIKDSVDNPMFGIFYHLMTRFMDLPVYCITTNNIFTR